MSTNPYFQYQENQLKTATPGKLLIMAYDAAIRFARLAAEKMQQGKLDEQSANIIKVQNIILELISSIDPKFDAQLSANLQSIYSYMFDRLTQANIRDDAAALQEVIQMLIEMRSAWADAERLVRTGGSAKAEARAT